jgi:glutathione S-transferase
VNVKTETVERGKQGYDLGHPLKKCPVMKVGNDVIFESNAIVRFVANQTHSKILGSNNFETVRIFSYFSFLFFSFLSSFSFFSSLFFSFFSSLFFILFSLISLLFSYFSFFLFSLFFLIQRKNSYIQIQSEIDGWIDLASNEIDRPMNLWLHTVQGSIPNNVDATKKAIADVRKVLQSLDSHLLSRTYLVGERLSLADIVVAIALLPGYRMLLDPGFRKAFKNTNRWFMTCINQPNFISVLGEVSLCEKKPVAPAPEKKEEPKKEQPKKEQPKKEQPKKEEDEDDGPPPEPKKKPFSHLPPSKFVLNDFKVAYSNEDYRTVSLPHFYQHFDAEGWTLWFVEYKYPEDLQKSFMVSNLLGGFCQRAECIRDFAFGSFLIFGEENNYEIYGAMLLRGTEWPADVVSVFFTFFSFSLLIFFITIFIFSFILFSVFE